MKFCKGPAAAMARLGPRRTSSRPVAAALFANGLCVGVTMVGRGRQTCCLPARFPALAAPKHWALGSYALDAMRSQEPAQR